MIETAIINALKADAAIRQRVTKYDSEASIFSEFAPESVKLPYITIDLYRNKLSDDLVLHSFTLMVDYWAYTTEGGLGTTRKIAREASERIEFLLDNKQFQSDRYDTIRVWFFSGGWVEDEDTRTVHYNQQFIVRAGRKKWIHQL